MAATPLDLSDDMSWPGCVHAALADAREMLAAFEAERQAIDRRARDDILLRINPPDNPHAAARATLIGSIDATVGQGTILAWHCTRLLPHERDWIEQGGLGRHSRDLFVRRMNAAVAAGALCQADADRRLRHSQIGERGRDGLLHLILNRAILRDELDIADLLRNWGGEAIYNNLGRGGDNPVSPIAVQSRASIIEVEVPVGDLARLPLSIGEQIVNRHADSQDILTEHGWGTNAKLVSDLPASNVRAIVQVGDERFGWLTNCAVWDDPV